MHFTEVLGKKGGHGKLTHPVTSLARKRLVCNVRSSNADSTLLQVMWLASALVLGGVCLCVNLRYTCRFYLRLCIDFRVS
jgi:hypothetical protein